MNPNRETDFQNRTGSKTDIQKRSERIKQEPRTPTLNRTQIVTKTTKTRSEDKPNSNPNRPLLSGLQSFISWLQVLSFLFSNSVF